VGKSNPSSSGFPKVDAVGNFTVFNIKGNNYRLIVSIDYEQQLIYIKYILTHAEYDKEKTNGGCTLNVEQLMQPSDLVNIFGSMARVADMLTGKTQIDLVRSSWVKYFMLIRCCLFDRIKILWKVFYPNY
jgi:hypothetical protein